MRTNDTVTPVQLALMLIFLFLAGAYLDRETGTAAVAVSVLLSAAVFFSARSVGRSRQEDGAGTRLAALLLTGFLAFRTGELVWTFSSFWIRSVTPAGNAIPYALPMLLCGMLLAASGYRGIGRLSELMLPLLLLSVLFTAAPLTGTGAETKLPAAFHTAADLPLLALLAGSTVDRTSSAASVYAAEDERNTARVFPFLPRPRFPVVTAGLTGIGVGGLFLLLNGIGKYRTVGKTLYGSLAAPGLYAVRLSLGEGAEPLYLLCLFVSVLVRLALLLRSAGELTEICGPHAKRFSVLLSALLGGAVFLLLRRFGLNDDRTAEGCILLTECLLTFFFIFSKKSKKGFDKRREKR